MKYAECPKCKYQVSICVLISAKYNYGCPNCHTSFNKFELKNIESDK